MKIFAVNVRSGSLAAAAVIAIALNGRSQPAPGTWSSQVLDRIAGEEYGFSRRDDGSISAPNRAHGLRATITAQGFDVAPREGGGDWSFALALSGAGRTGALELIGDGFLSMRDREAVIARGGSPGVQQGWLEESFDNDSRGLEHRIAVAMNTFAGRALAISATNRIVLEFHLTTNLRAVPEGSPARSIRFDDAAGHPVLRYGGLRVTDQRGTELDAELKLHAGLPSSLSIEIDDRGALYPLSVDPLLSSATWSVESDQSGAFLGWSVATAGDVNGDGFSDVLVGALFYDNGENNEGRAFLYPGSPSGPATTPAWSYESNQALANLGRSVSAAGDVNNDGYDDVIIGAPGYDTPAVDAGRAFLFMGSAAGLAVTPARTLGSAQAGASFGWSVATAGDVNGDGYADVIVGARLFDNGSLTDEGSASVFAGSVSGLSGTPAITVEGGSAGANFGRSVSTAGDVNGDGYADVIIGSSGYSNGQASEGRALVYLGSSGGLTATPGWSVESDQAGAEFGYSVSTAGDVNGDGYADVIVGSWLYDNGQIDEGLAFIYHGSGTGLSTTAAWTVESDQAAAQMGWSVGTAGDTNGDGYADVIVGTLLWDNGEVDEGRAAVYPGSASGV